MVPEVSSPPRCDAARSSNPRVQIPDNKSQASSEHHGPCSLAGRRVAPGSQERTSGFLPRRCARAERSHYRPRVTRAL